MYTKPTLLTTSALDAIRSTDKGQFDDPDSVNPVTFNTATAYEADE